MRIGSKKPNIINDNRSQWYAVNTNPKCEDLVCELLSRESAFEVFLPKVKNRKKNRVEPLFPGYLFVKLNVRLADWVRIKYLHGVRKVLGFGNTPIPVHDDIIDTVQRSLREDTYSSRSKLSLKAGDKVAFAGGPFAGLEGRVICDMSGRERVKVLLDAIRRSFVVEVEADAVSRVG